MKRLVFLVLISVFTFSSNAIFNDGYDASISYPGYICKDIGKNRSLWQSLSDPSYGLKNYKGSCRSFGPVADQYSVVPSIAHDGWVCLDSIDLKSQSFWYIEQDGIQTGKLHNGKCNEWAQYYGDTLIPLNQFKSLTKIGLKDGSQIYGIYDKTDKGVASIAFKGVPYAKAPVGKRRWEMPESIGKIGEFKADKFGPACPQPLGSDDYILKAGINEDCLQLNVWTPLDKNINSNLPVIVWIHGGGLNAGVSHKVSYRGASMAAKGAIFVSINYRLGHLGFFAHSAQDKNSPRGNYGLYDQIEALRWVKRNINKFGGNPHNVTIVGESAGASSVLYHLTSDKTKGLFHKAIMQSTPVLINHAPIEGKNESSPYALTATQTSSLLASKLGCKNDNLKLELDCLRNFPARKLPDLGKSLRTGFYIDGYLHEKTPRILATEEGGLRNIPIMIGSNEDEYTFFGKVPYKSTDEFRKFFFDSFGFELAQNLLSFYPARNMAEMRESYINFHTDYMFGIDAMYTAAVNVKMGNKDIFHYHFTRIAPGAEKIGLDAAHGFEIPYFFDNIPVEDDHDFYNQVDHDIAKEMSFRILYFAKHGNPNYSKKGLKWNAYTPLGESLMIGDDFNIITGHLEKEAKTLIDAKKVTLPISVPPTLERLFERSSLINR